jgi:hypothetical protein
VPRRLDPLPLTASVLVLAVVGFYLFLANGDGSRVAWWAVAVLVAGIAGTAYASSRRAVLRRLVLGVCAVALGLLGWITLFSIGRPLMLATALCVAAVLRGRPAKDWRDTV